MPQWLSSQQGGRLIERQALMPIGGDEDADLLPDREPIGSAFFKAYTPSLPAATGKKRILKKYSVLIILGVIALFKVSLVLSIASIGFRVVDSPPKLTPLVSIAFRHADSHALPRPSRGKEQTGRIRAKKCLGSLVEPAGAFGAAAELGLGRESPCRGANGDPPPLCDWERPPGPARHPRRLHRDLSLADGGLFSPVLGGFRPHRRVDGGPRKAPRGTLSAPRANHGTGSVGGTDPPDGRRDAGQLPGHRLPDRVFSLLLRPCELH